MKPFKFRSRGKTYTMERLGLDIYKIGVEGGGSMEIDRTALLNFAGYERAYHNIEYYEGVWAIREETNTPPPSPGREEGE